MLKIGGFWDTTLCPFRHFEESPYPNVRGSGSSSPLDPEDDGTRNPEDVDLMDLRFLRISGLRTSNSWFYEAPYVVYKTMGIQLDEQVSWVRNICKFLMNKLTLICHWIWQNKLTSIQIVKCVRNGIELNWIKWLILIIKPKGSTNISNLFLD